MTLQPVIEMAEQIVMNLMITKPAFQSGYALNVDMFEALSPTYQRIYTAQMKCLFFNGKPYIMYYYANYTIGDEDSMKQRNVEDYFSLSRYTDLLPYDRLESAYIHGENQVLFGGNNQQRIQWINS